MNTTFKKEEKYHNYAGGFFDYKQYEIDQIADLIQEIIDNNVYTVKTVNVLQYAVYYVRKAFVYAQRIDWFVSGDESEDSFHSRLKEDLDEIKRPEPIIDSNVDASADTDLNNSYWESNYSDFQYTIIKIADKIEQLIEFNEQEQYQYSPKTIAQFSFAIESLHVAFIYAKYVNWLINGLNENRFIDSLTKALNEN